MEYLDYLNRTELLAKRSRCSTELNQLKIKKEDDEMKDQVDAVKLNLNEIIKACDERLKAKVEDKNLLLGGAKEQHLPLVTANDDIIKTFRDNARSQNILDTIMRTNKLKTGDSIENFVGDLHQIYSIEVQPQLGKLPNLETEFINAVKRLLTYPMYIQLEKSGKNLTKWSDLQKYLIATHGKRISNYQHLHQLWNCRLYESEKLSDFGARLEDKVWSAAVHIQASYRKSNENREMSAEDVFHLFGALLAALQIKESYGDAYKSLIKTCDKHWTASSLLSDAADYVDKMSTGEIEDTQNTAFHSRVLQNVEKKKKSALKDHLTKKSRDRLEEYKQKCKNEICEAFMKGSCKYGSRCFRIHPENEQNAHYTEVEPTEDGENESEENEIGNLFH